MLRYFVEDEMVILGIDPGLAIVGWGVVDYCGSRFRTLGYGSIETPAGMATERRLSLIYEELKKLIETYHPEHVAVEELFFNTNTTTAIDVAQARGVIVLAAAQGGLDIAEYTPLQVKQSVVGYGRAEKKQVQEMTRIMLNLEKIPKPDDAADALAMAICHCHSAGSLIGRLGRR